MDAPLPRKRSDVPAIPDHELLTVIGAGSYGEVWLARNIFGVYRAVKIVRRSAFDDARPFEREFSGVQSFEPVSRSHPGLVDILHVGRNDDEGYFYCVMEVADDAARGTEIIPEQYTPKTVASEIRTHERLPIDQCIQTGLSISAGLRALHDSGLVHRDIKPSNIIFVGGVPKLADIGLVHSITSAETLVGTQGYIPPEGPGSVQADLYALGKVLYELSTGNDRQQFPELPRDLLLSDEKSAFIEFNEVLVRACDARASNRYTSAAQIESDLLLIRSGSSLRRLRTLERRWKVCGKTALVAVILGTLLATPGYLFYRQYERVKTARAHQTVASLNYGARLLDEKDTFAALNWFVDSFATDRDPANAITHRARIASVLRNPPYLTQCWWQNTAVNGAEFSPDGKLIAVAEKSGAVSVIRREDGEVIWRVQHGTAAEAELARFSRDGTLLVTGGQDQFARVWSMADGSCLARLPHTHDLHAVEFSPDGKYVLTASGGGNLLLWDVATEQIVRRFIGHRDSVRSATFSPDGAKIVSGSVDDSAIVWDANTGEMLHLLPHKDWVYDAAFSPDGATIVTACSDANARLWNVADGRLQAPVFPHDTRVKSVRWSPDGRFLVTSSFDFNVRVWDALKGELISKALRHPGFVPDASFSPDGRYILTFGWDRTVRVWDFVPELPDPTPGYYAADGTARFRRDGSTLLRLDNGEWKPVLDVSYPWSKLWLSESGNRLVAVPDAVPGSACVGYDFARNKQLQLPGPFPTKTEGVLANNAPIAVLTFDSTVEVWNLEIGERLAQADYPENKVKAAISPDGRTVAVLAGFSVHLMKWSPGVESPPPLTHRLPVSTAVFSDDGQRLMTGCADGYLTEGYARVWNPNTGEPLSPELKHGDGVLAVAFSPDPRFVAVGGEDFTARVWNLESFQPLLPFRHQDQVYTVRFSEGGRWLVSGSEDKTSRVWDLATATPITPPMKHLTVVRNAVVSPNDRQLRTTVHGGATILRDLSPATHSIEELRTAARFLSGEIPLETPVERQAVLALVASYHVSAPSSVWHLTQATACEWSKHYFGARFHLEQLPVEERNGSNVLHRLATAQAELGNYLTALATWVACAQSDKGTDDTYGRIGLLRLAANDLDGAAETAAAMARFPIEQLASSRNAWFLALAPSSVTDSNVIDTLFRYCRTQPGRNKEAAALAWKLGRYEDAVALFGRNTVPKSAPDLMLSAVLCAGTGDWDRAKLHAVQARQVTHLSSLKWDERVRLQLLESHLVPARAELQAAR